MTELPRPDKATTGPVRLSRAFGSSFRGFGAAWREEEAFRQECLLALAVVPLGLWLGESGVERALLAGPMLLILVIELLNSAVEAIVDRIGVERHPLSGISEIQQTPNHVLAILRTMAIDEKGRYEIRHVQNRIRIYVHVGHLNQSA